MPASILILARRFPPAPGSTIRASRPWSSPRRRSASPSAARAYAACAPPSSSGEQPTIVINRIPTMRSQYASICLWRPNITWSPIAGHYDFLPPCSARLSRKMPDVCNSETGLQSCGVPMNNSTRKWCGFSRQSCDRCSPTWWIGMERDAVPDCRFRETRPTVVSCGRLLSGVVDRVRPTSARRPRRTLRRVFQGCC